MALVDDYLLLEDGTVDAASHDSIRAAIGSKKKFWLDLIDLDGDDLKLLSDDFGLHPLAVDDAESFGQRPKIDSYDGYTYLVVYGAHESDLVEVHIVYSSDWVITVRRRPCQGLDDVRKRASKRVTEEGFKPADFLYRICDGLVDSFFPVLEEFDERIDGLEDDILENPTEDQLGSLFDMKRRLVGYRRAITPQRDMFASLVAGASDLPGITSEDERYLRDVYDHLIRISDLVDSYRDLLTGAMDTHLSTVSNRLNVVMKQLTIIATIFLPLSFITGFFGQNFGWMVNHIGSGGAFFALGLGCDLAAIVGLLAYFKRKSWL